MDDVKAALDALASATSKHKKEHIRSAIDKPKSVYRILGLSSSHKVLSQLSAIFDDGLKALYQAFPLQTMQFSAAVLRAIVREKVQSTEDRSIRYAWENIQKSVVSSALDALEANQTDSMKSSVATAFYTSIRDLYYSNDSALEVVNHNLIFNVNLLLSESARNHSENQNKLRGERILGPHRLASTILQSRDYFVLDSVLTVLGAILPDQKLAAAKRTAFIDSVFPHAKFLCSGQIKGHIHAAETPWDNVIAKIIDECLANIDISYPQPFRIDRLDSSSPLLNFLDPFYIDKNAFYANIDMGETIDSYQVPFLNLERVVLSGAVTDTVSVTLTLNAAPMIGPHDPFAVQDAAQEHTLSFQLQSCDRGRFVKSLYERGVGDKVRDGVDRKVSKLMDGLSLENPSTIVGRRTENERAEARDAVWHSNGDELDAEDDTSGAGPTSPLVLPETSLTGLNSKMPVFGGDLSDIEVEDKPKSNAKAKRIQPALDSPSPVKKGRGKSKARMRVVDSDSEAEAEAESKDAPQRKPTAKEDVISRHPSRARTRTAKAIEQELKKGTVLVPSSSPMDDANDDDFEPTQQEPTEQAKTRPKDQMVRQSAKGKENQLPEVEDDEEPAGKHKRATRRDDKETKLKLTTNNKRTQPDNEDDEEPAEDNIRPAKRQRRTTDMDEGGTEPITARDSAAVFGTIGVPLAKKRYGRKAGRTSSPERALRSVEDDMDVDFDELPSTVLLKSKAKANVEPVSDVRRGQVSAMKAKGGQKAERNEPVAKAKATAEKKTSKRKSAADEDDDVDMLPADDVKPTRSPRRKNQGPNRSQRTKKAPWEDMHLNTKENVPGTSDDAIPSKSDVAAEEIPAYREYLEPVNMDIFMAVDTANHASPSKSAQAEHLPFENPVVPLQAPPSPIVPVPALPVALPDIYVPTIMTSAANPPAASPPPTTITAAVSPAVSTRILPVQNVLQSKPTRTAPDIATVTPSNPLEPAPAMPKSKAPIMTSPVKYDTPPAVPAAKLPSLFKQPNSQKVPAEKPSSPVFQTHRQSPVQRRFNISNHDDSPFPERVRQSVTFAPSPSPVERAERMDVDRGYGECTDYAFLFFPDVFSDYPHRGRSSNKYVQDEKIRAKKQSRSRSPMQGIIETLNEIQEVVLEKIAQRFEGVRHDVRVGRDELLRTANTNLEGHCVEGEKHFNVLVDFEEEYAAYVRKKITSIGDVQQRTEVLSTALGSVIQQHDRRTLAKKLPMTIFNVPSVFRNPVLAL
ncbi:hypothetical protein C8F01DRAFT_1256477 [Mycena amicta]|nr:hypothetical protein C8F01DRAFT_1256477 [Mycena amicta]